MTWIIPFILLNFYGGTPFVVNHSLFFALLMSLLLVLKPISLPILYTFMQKKSNDENVQRFIYLLKTSNEVKLKVLFISVIPSVINCFCGRSGFTFTSERFLDLIMNIHIFVLYALFFSLLGSYLLLYLYWYIEDKAKSYISKQNTLLSKTVILFKLMI